MYIYIEVTSLLCFNLDFAVKSASLTGSCLESFSLRIPGWMLEGCQSTRAQGSSENRALFPLSSRVLIIPYCWWGFWLWSFFFSAISKYRFTEGCKTCTILVAMDFVTKLEEMAGFQLDGASS